MPFVHFYPSKFKCVACPQDCTECDSTKSCKISYTSLLRVFILGVQSFCATIVLILMVTTFRLRRSKVTKSLQINHLAQFDSVFINREKNIFFLTNIA